MSIAILLPLLVCIIGLLVTLFALAGHVLRL